MKHELCSDKQCYVMPIRKILLSCYGHPEKLRKCPLWVLCGNTNPTAVALKNSSEPQISNFKFDCQNSVSSTKLPR